MKDNVIDYAEMRKKFAKRQKELRRNLVEEDHGVARRIPMTEEQIKLSQRKREFWKYLVKEFVDKNDCEMAVKN